MAAENSKNDKTGLAVGAGGLGYLDYNKGSIKSDLTGRKVLYHTTPSENIQGIMENGLLGSKALDPTNATNTVMEGRGINDGRKLVYLGKTKNPTNGMNGYFKQNGIKTKRIKVSIPLDEYRKLKFTDNNPEFLGAKNANEWVRLADIERQEGNIRAAVKAMRPNGRIIENGRMMTSEEYTKYRRSKIQVDPNMKATVSDRYYYNKYSGKKNSPTRIVEGDINAKYIQGSRHYKKLGPQELAQYIKKHPKRFMRGTGKAALGIGSVGTGLWIVRRNSRD